MANRCYWLSTTEVMTHILSGGDALQTHHNTRVFTRQLQWCMEQCERQLNGEAPIDDILQNELPVQTVKVNLSTEFDNADDALQPIDEAEDDDEDQGCVLLHYLPKAVYVKMTDNKDMHLPTTKHAKADLEGVLAITPTSRPWRFQASSSSANGIQVTRSQIPLLPQKQCTLPGMQETTADPGFIVHWTFTLRLPHASQWLATYVSLSRLRRFKNLLNHGLPSREPAQCK